MNIEDSIGLEATIQFTHPQKAPRGVTGMFRALIWDERVEWTFRDRLSTMILASEMRKNPTPGEKVDFDIKRNVGITEYPGLCKEEIKNKLLLELEKFKKKN